ncbi:MAG TPA: sigma-70 family RNA polymerase sigma factor [Reyranella sp.]|nr:sigma-70 family RNA polymerase sigma factor [Reyranella sp.]
MPGETTSLFIEHRHSLVDYAAGIMGSRVQAEDVVHEAYIRFSAADSRAAARPDSPTPDRPIAHPLAYLYTIVRNLSLTWIRRASVETPVEPDGPVIAAVASDAPSVESALIHREDLRTLAEALIELPPRTQRAFSMHRVEGRPLREVAEHLDISVARAQQLVKAAMIHGVRRMRERSA